MSFSVKELNRLKEAASLLFHGEARLPVLGRISWPPDVAERFFAAGASELPQPAYEPIDPTPSRERADAARALVVGDSPVHRWLIRLADTVDETAKLLSTLGTAAFFTHSQTLYGGPHSTLADGRVTALALAKRLDGLLADYRPCDLGTFAATSYDAAALKSYLDAELPKHFGAEAPRVEVLAEVSAKAVAGRDTIKLRANATFSDLDLRQLLQHEALVHIATGKNGRAQPHFPILGESHPGNARTQEGLAVFAEFISGALDPKRLQRLGHRVLAVEMASEGADFLQLYGFFLERTGNEFESFESARRVVRGGLVEGGAPFTKDCVYLQGLLEIHSFLRAAVRAGDTSMVPLLFVGKFDLGDLDALIMLRKEGLLAEPLFMPNWASDLRFLVSYLAYSVFLNEVNLGAVSDHYLPLFDELSTGSP